MLVEQCPLAHHLDRSGTAGIEHQTKAALQQFAHPKICQKSFFLAAGKAKEFLRLAEPPGDLRMLTQKEIAARRHYAGPNQADPRRRGARWPSGSPLRRLVEHGGHAEILVQRPLQELQFDVELVKLGIAQVSGILGKGSAQPVDDFSGCA
jgi:hypothetical protein